MSVSQFLRAPLGYWCRFEWYNSSKGTDGGGYELRLLLISISQGFFLFFLFSPSFFISVSQALVLRVFIRGETEVRVSLTFDWEYIVWVCVFIKTKTPNGAPCVFFSFFWISGLVSESESIRHTIRFFFKELTLYVSVFEGAFFPNVLTPR